MNMHVNEESKIKRFVSGLRREIKGSGSLNHQGRITPFENNFQRYS